MLWASTAINALPTRGIWPAGKAARIVIATPTIPLALPAMRLDHIQTQIIFVGVIKYISVEINVCVCVFLCAVDCGPVLL